MKIKGCSFGEISGVFVWDLLDLFSLLHCLLSAPLSVGLWFCCVRNCIPELKGKSSIVLGVRFHSAQKLVDIYLMRIPEELCKLELLGISFPELFYWEAMGN